MKERYSSKKLFITAVTAILLGLLYYTIFDFSAQDAEASGSLSQYVSGKCAEILNSLSGNRWNQDTLYGIAEAMEHPLRKLAHFTEYACMGVLVYTLWSQWISRGRKLYLLTSVWVFLSAAGDEFHQYFVPGRYASFWDVLLDTCGGVCGMLFCIGVILLYERAGRKRRTRKVPQRPKNLKVSQNPKSLKDPKTPKVRRKG